MHIATLYTAFFTQCGYTVETSHSTLHAIFDEELPSCHTIMIKSRNPKLRALNLTSVYVKHTRGEIWVSG